MPQLDSDVEADCADTAAIAQEALLPGGMDSDQLVLKLQDTLFYCKSKLSE